MNYDVEADWLLLLTCNFRCPYCFYADIQKTEPIMVFGNPQQWKEAFDRTGKTWLLHITGGEPSLYSDFVKLCKAL